jgi:hypothetical protein
MDLDIEPCTAFPTIRGQVLRVTVNGHRAGGCRLVDRTLLRCHIEPDILGDSGTIEIRFDHPCFVRGDIAGVTEDERPLAFCFRGVTLYSVSLAGFFDRYTQGSTVAVLRDSHLRNVDLSDKAAANIEARSYDFGANDPGRQFLREGWFADAAGKLWASAPISSINLPIPEQPGSYRLRVSLAPLLIRDVLPRQTITVLVQDCVVGQFRLSSDTVLSLPLPVELVTGFPELHVTFVTRLGVSMWEFEDGPEGHQLSFLLERVVIEPVPSHISAIEDMRGDDTGPVPQLDASVRFLDASLDDLPQAVEANFGIEIPTILREFESLGDNCALGLAQRKGGVEVLGMLRFANTPLKNLVAGLDDEFRAASDPSQMTVGLHSEGNPREYMLRLDRYGIRWHTMVHETAADAETVFEEQSTKTAYLRRKFIESLRAGRKIYALTRKDPIKVDTVMPAWGADWKYELRPEDLRLAEVLPVFLALNRTAKNTLVYLVGASRHGKRSGVVEMLAPGLLIGYIDSEVILEDVAVKDHVEWMRVLVNAWILEHGANAIFRDSQRVIPRAVDDSQAPVFAATGGTEQPALSRLPVPKTVSDLMSRFESIGENCEFGLVQRRGGAEPLGLFRFASAPYDKLMNALDCKFEGLGSPDMVDVQVSGNGREYMVLDKKFGLLSHAWVMVGEMTPEEVHAREIRRLPFLVRKVLEDLSRGEKIFVFHGMQPLTLAQAGQLSAALRRYGPTILLWVELADDQHKSGSVEKIETGLLKGYIDRFAPGEDAHDFSFESWVDICWRAYHFWANA